MVGTALAVGAALGTLIVMACVEEVAPLTIEISGDASLSARPSSPSEPLLPGKHALGLSGQRDGFIYIPDGLAPDVPAPLLVLMHGAGGEADNWESAFSLADSLGIVFLATDSRARTWDVLVLGIFGPDVAFLDSALEKTFRSVAVDPSKIALGGFSDGASYALSVGLSNGDLFTHVVAWSPGFSAPTRQQGRPRVFVSHGSNDAVLSVQNTRIQIVASLEQAGYSVRYEEFDGGHEIPAAIARQALIWFLEL